MTVDLVDQKFVGREIELRRRLADRIHRDRRRGALAEATNLDDLDLLDRLVNHGFSLRDVAALDYAPLAFISWADGYVTPEERSTAFDALAIVEELQPVQARMLLSDWLEVRPGRSLFRLWEDFASARVMQWDGPVDEPFCRRVLDAATSIAVASGGVLGFGAICPAEQRILDRMASIYGL